MGVGWWAYIGEGWNQFDFVIVIGTLFGIILRYAANVEVGSVASIVRMFRMGRIFRLFHSFRTLKQLFNTLVASLPSLINVGMLLLIMFFIFAVLGVQLFATITENDDLNAHANFQSFEMALLTLFRFSTGENWNGVMYSMAYAGGDDCEEAPEYDPNWCIYHPTKPPQDPDADDDDPPGCKPLNGCGQWTVFPYFYIFTLSVTFIMLNLFIGIILDAFGDETEEVDSLLNDANLDVFVNDWTKFDDPKKDKSFLRVNQLKDFMQILDEPMGFGEDVVANDEDLEHRILNLNLEVTEQFVEEEDLGNSLVHIYHVATALARRLTVMKQGDKFADLPKERRAGATVGGGFAGARQAAALVADMPGGGEP